jgi:hypothetical protein
MRKILLILIIAATGFFSCKHGGNSTQEKANINTLDWTKSKQSQKPTAKQNVNNFYTKYEYNESNGTRLIIQNSFPKSGGEYIDPNGKKYVYAVFWTQITNLSIEPIELTINFPSDSFEIPTSSGNFMKLLLPANAMTIDKAPMYDYGLPIKSFLDNNRDKSSSMRRIINSKGNSAFYVVTLSNRGVGGTLRTGLSLRGINLFYRINEKEISCGKFQSVRINRF